MLFSRNFWEENEEMNRIIPVSSALSFERVESSLRDAEEMFLVPVLGEKLMAKVAEIYASASVASSGDAQSLDERLLKMLQRAEANLALWYNFDELNVRITDQGFQRQTTENFTGAYKYQEDNLKRNFKTKGMNALDAAITFLMEHEKDFSDFKESVAYKHRKTAIVKSLSEADKIYCIYQSPLVWLRLEPVIREVEETILPGMIGDKCYDALRKALDKKEEKIGEELTETLRMKVARYVVTLAVSMLLKRGGTLTDRGLYFEKEVATNLSGTASVPAELENVYKLAREVGDIAIRYRNLLDKYIRNSLPDLYGGSESDVLMRDNDNHSCVFL